MRNFGKENALSLTSEEAHDLDFLVCAPDLDDLDDLNDFDDLDFDPDRPRDKFFVTLVTCKYASWTRNEHESPFNHVLN